MVEWRWKGNTDDVEEGELLPTYLESTWQE